ncbi:MAG: regulatory iron-sulfur-containing complex subunit RicT [Parafannyhessea sp.]|uniref:PSP1 domain-containing protein n=1 Tax=Parafannyhessea sp. TaxID=2847324 RepID=UPI003F06B373
MPTVLSVKFKYAAHDLWFDPAKSGAQEGDHVICATERGQEIGLATMDPMEVSKEHLREVIGESGRLQPVIRVAGEKDLDRAEMLADRGDEAFPTFKRLAHESGLDMKPVGVEYLFGGGKVVCYFSAEDRVDFRQLVRDLSRELHERVDMRQIGVREEAAIVGGFGHCGQELCCTRFGRRFEPVSIRMAKEQDLPLNSSKISGACGRLMCCLRYEFEAYRDFKSRAPKRNAVIETPLGKAKIVEYDTPKEQICLRLENGKQIRVPLADMEASPAAHKKSEELGCACRPDTVTRSALEKLQSPEVQMALAELDRKSGKVPAETFDDSDIFVETKPRRRRRGAGQPAQQASGTNGAARAEDAGRKPRPKHARPASAPGDEAAQEGTPRRRRRKKAEAEDAQTGAPTPRGERRSGEKNASDQPRNGGMHRRRHHHNAGDGQAQDAGAQAGGSQRQKRGPKPEGASGKGSGTAQKQGARRRRRPGDHGGQAAGAPGAGAGAGGNGDSGPTDAQGEGRPRRRRRHRGSGGNGGASGNGGNGNGSKPGGSPSASE